MILFCLGWSHFAQFTIALINKDPKKSKYSGEFNDYLPFLVPTSKIACFCLPCTTSVY
jgi:hypothetical protein